MFIATIAGRVGKDAKHTTTQGGTDICSFTVATDVGYGDRKQTLWVDVSKFGKGAQGLSNYVRKGDPITVSGELSTREYEGKTYLQLNAHDVALQGRKDDGSRQQSGDPQGGNQSGGHAPNPDDLDDDIPFDRR